MAAPASSSDSSLPPSATHGYMMAWDHMLPAAREAGNQAVTAADEGSNKRTAYVEQFVRTVMRDAHARLDEVGMVYVDAELEWQIRRFNRIGHIHDLYIFLSSEVPVIGGSRSDPISLADLDADSQPVLVHQLRRIAQLPAIWEPLLTLVTASMARKRPAEAAEYAEAFYEIMQEVNGSMRVQIQHKLELLARRVPSLSPAATAAELRAILAEVETAAAPKSSSN